jgi:glycosyltransferase involved in cell wall biosynthesis
MNVLHINAWDNVGGAARAMYRLHGELRRLGYGSKLLVGHQTLTESEVGSMTEQLKPFRGPGDRVLDRLGAQLDRISGFDTLSYRDSWDVPKTTAFRQADVINLHNLHGGYFNFRAIPELARHKPIVWTLHDMWALTGHCSYSYACERWRTGCHHCPLLKEPGRRIVEPKPVPLDRTRSIWDAKRRVYQGVPSHVVVPSRWLYDLVGQSILASAASVRHIPYGIDLELFHPVAQEVARCMLDLPVDAQVMFFSAAGVSNERKGFSYLLQALERLPSYENFWLLTSGGRADLPPSSGRLKVRQLGYLDEERIQRLALAAADVFVFPTLADNLPLVAIEAQACGTPVVSFDVGGVSEIVRHMDTGYLARYRDVDDLARGISTVLGSDELRGRMRLRCRQVAEAEYSLKLQARRYIELYDEVIEMAHALPEPE